MPLHTFDDPLPLPSLEEVLTAVTPINAANWDCHWRNGVGFPHHDSFGGGISRANIFEAFRRGDWGRGVVATLIWGYPRGRTGRGGGDGIGDALWNCEAIGATLQQLQGQEPHPALDVITALDELVVGVGPATTSKWAYFAELTVNEGPALIYDSMVRRAIRALHHGEFDHLKAEIQPWGNQSDLTPTQAEQTYGLYVNTLCEVAATREAHASQIEYQLFRFGRISGRV